MKVMSSFWKSSITRKLLTYVFSIYLIITFTVTIAHMYFEYKNADARIKDELALFERMVKDVLAEALWNFDEAQVQSTIMGVTNSGSVVGAKVVSDSDRMWFADYYLEENADGEEVSSYYNVSSGELVTDKDNISSFNDQVREAMKLKPEANSFITHPFIIQYTDEDGSVADIGKAYFYSSTDTVFNQVKGGFLLILANAIFKTLALWFLFLTVGYYYLSKPLLALTHATHQVKKGNLDIEKLEMDVSWETEIDVLTNNFNYMIDDLRVAREDLHTTQERLKEIVDLMPSVIIVVDSDIVITDWNGHAEEFTGVEAKDAVGYKLDKAHPPYATYLDNIQKAFDSWEAQHIHNIITYVDNVKNHFDVVIYPIYSGKSGAVIRMDNITNRVQMESAMVQTEKMSSVGSLAAGMAHEINNPLGAILQGAQNIVRRLDPQVPANKKVADELEVDLDLINKYLEKRRIFRFMDGIKEAGERAAKIVANLLQFSRKTNANKLACSLKSIVDKSIELARTDYDLKKKTDFRRVQIDTEYEENLPDIHACSMEIEQVVLNLLKNAGQAMKEMETVPQIKIKMSSVDKFVVLEIIDNGPGMSNSVKKRIFEPFFTTKPVGEGTGLGLSVSYGIIVESHHGEMFVDSTEGVGTHFTLKLPIAYQENNMEEDKGQD